MIDSDVIQALQEQFNKERENSQVYSYASNICKNTSFDGFAKFFMKQSQQELDHAQMVADFLISKRVAPAYKVLDAVGLSSSLPELTQSVYKLEISTTDALEELYRVAEANEEYQVCSFLVDMLKEQIEEELWSFDLADLVGKADYNGLILLDHLYGEK